MEFANWPVVQYKGIMELGLSSAEGHLTSRGEGRQGGRVNLREGAQKKAHLDEEVSTNFLALDLAQVVAP